MIPPPLPANTPPPLPRPSRKEKLVVRIVLIVTMLFAAFLAFRIVEAVIYHRKHPIKYPPGSQELTDASTMIISSRRGTALGNSPEAKVVAGKVSADLKDLRQAMFSEGNADSIDMKMFTKGEFVVFCQLNRDSCAVLIHVPEMRNYTESAGKEMSALAYNIVCLALPPEKRQSLRKLAVATRGKILYNNILVGESGFDTGNPASLAIPMANEDSRALGLREFFVEK